jgi:predicted ATP-grasp superfamily ATP-dependent carboligase
MNTVDGAIRNDIADGESMAIGSNLVVGKNIVNSGNLYAKSILINDAVIENTILTNAFIENIPISSRSISFISTLSSDVQLQLDTISKKKDQ